MARNEQRRASRAGVNIRAEIRESGGGRFEVWVKDLSQTGFRVGLFSHLDHNKAVFLHLPGFAPMPARIAWHQNDEYGCHFSQPLHIAVFEHIIRVYPGLSRF